MLVSYSINKKDKNVEITYISSDTGLLGTKVIEIKPEDEYILERSGRKTSILSWDSNPYENKYLKKKKTKSLNWSVTRLREFILEHLSEKEFKDVFGSLREDVKIHFIDIETEILEDYGFCGPEKPIAAIQTISICNQKGSVITLGYKPMSDNDKQNALRIIQRECGDFSSMFDFKFNYIQFENESIMLETFVNKLLPKFVCITGWNFTGFDWEYIVNRCDMLNISFKNINLQKNKLPTNLVVLDLMELYDAYETKKSVNKKLNTVSQDMLGIGKLEFDSKENLDNLYKDNFTKYVAYNAIDTILTMLIENKNMYFRIHSFLSELANAGVYEVFMQTAITEWKFQHEYLKRGLHCGEKTPEEKEYIERNCEKQDVIGGYVYDGIKQVSYNIASYDFSSLYPSLIKSLNVSAESFIGMYKTGNDSYYNEDEKIITDENIINNNIKTEYGALFLKHDDEHPSVLFEMLSNGYKIRKGYQRQSLEISSKIESIERDSISETDELKKLKSDAHFYHNLQTAVKIYWLNGCGYGVFASKYFYFFNRSIANAITFAGRSVNTFTQSVIVKYLTEKYNTDTYIHKIFKKEFGDDFNDVQKNVEDKKYIAIYGDTDSNYISLNRLIELNFNNDILKDQHKVNQIILLLDKYRLQKLINDSLEKYHIKINARNMHLCELENVYKSFIFLSKKHYVADVTFAMPDIEYESGHKLKLKGIELVKSSSCNFAKKYLNDELVYLVKNINTYSYEIALKRVKRLYDLFSVAAINNISTPTVISSKTYDNFVIDKEFKSKLSDCFKKAIPVHIRAAATYNSILTKNKKLLNKYDLIKHGDKILWYYTQVKNNTQDQNVFGFVEDEFPEEFAPPYNYEVNFEKMILQQFNRIISVVIGREIQLGALYTQSLF